jgi:hypothetical protein
VSRSAGHIRLPLDFDEDEGWASVGAIGQAIAICALTASARNLTDGYISTITYRRLTVDVTRKHAAQAATGLERIGFWQPVGGGGWQVVRWEQYAFTAEQVDEYRSSQAEKARAGGQARAATATRDGRGRMTSSTEPKSQPSVQPDGLDTHQPVHQPESSPDTDTDADTGFRPRASGPRTRGDDSFSDIGNEEEATEARSSASRSSDGRDDEDLSSVPRAAGPPDGPPGIATGGGIGDPVPDPVSTPTGVCIGRRGRRYDSTWPKASEAAVSGWETERCDAARQAWEAHGFRKPPTQKQWRLLEGVNDRDPITLAALIRDAPAGQSNEIVGCVLRRINADPRLRGFLAAGPTAEGRAREHRCPICGRAMSQGLDGAHFCLWRGDPWHEALTENGSGAVEQPPGDPLASTPFAGAQLRRNTDLATESNPPRCDCGEVKVATPSGRWVCTNPVGHRRAGEPNSLAVADAEDLPHSTMGSEAPA